MEDQERIVVIRFGRDGDPDCMRQDEILYSMPPYLYFGHVINETC